MVPDLSRRESVPVVVPLIGAALLGAVALSTDVSRPTLLRAGFTVVAALLAAVLYVGSRTLSIPRRRVPAPVATRAVLALSGGAVVASDLLASRLLPLAVLLPVGFGLVALQLRAEPSVPSVLTQVGALLAAATLSKYVTTGFYFGGTDTFAHVGAVQSLTRLHYATALPHGYDFYPVFHFLVGAVTDVTGLPPYAALVLTGIATVVLVIPAVYLLGRTLLGSRRLGLCCAAALPLVEFVHYHALYFFPQALALALLFVGVEANARLVFDDDRRRVRRLTAFLLALAATLVLTHHLTYVLVAVLVGLAVVVSAVRRLRIETPRPRLRWAFPSVVGGALLLAYWAYTPSTIIVGIVELGAGVLFDAVAVAEQRLFLYGLRFPADSIDRAVAWLATPTGSYAAGLSTLVLLGGYELLDRPRSYPRGLTVAVTGLLASAVLLPLPIPISQIERFQFVVVLVAVVPLGLGVRRAVGVDRRIAAVAVVVVAATAGTAAFTTVSADDLGSQVFLDQPSQQVEMNDAEYRTVQRVALFADRYVPGRAGTDRITDRAFETTRYNASRAVRPGAAGLSTPADVEFLVAREAWGGAIVPLGGGVRASSVRAFGVTTERFRAADARLDKLYTTGYTRLYYEDGGFAGLYGDSAR